MPIKAMPRIPHTISLVEKGSSGPDITAWLISRSTSMSADYAPFIG